jgi:peptidoglycan/xylan/chitin deacetylase (PgdA/CDA1 family)
MTNSRFQLGALLALLALSACKPAADEQASAATTTDTVLPTAETAAPPPATDAPSTTSSADHSGRVPNELGRIMVLEYHLIGDQEGRWERQRDQFRKDLELLYERGYRPVSMIDVLDKKIDLPRGLSPVVFTFDDASPSQFRYLEKDGKLEIDPTSGIGIWLDFAKQHSDWRNKAVFCMLSGAEAGRSFFGDKNIEGQKTAWRHQKVKFLADQGFELCNHTLWHAQLSKYPDNVVQEQIARLQMAVDSAVQGYQIRTLALPQGLWPKNRELAWRGSWTDPKSKRTINYNYDAVLEVSGGPNVSPYDPKFDSKSIDRVQIVGNELQKTMDQLDRLGTRYVSDGDPNTIARRATASNTAGDSTRARRP